MSLEEEAALVQGEVRARARLAAASGAREWLAARAGAIEHRQRKSGQFDPRRGLLRAAEMEQRAATVNLRRPHYFVVGKATLKHDRGPRWRWGWLQRG